MPESLAARAAKSRRSDERTSHHRPSCMSDLDWPIRDDPGRLRPRPDGGLGVGCRFPGLFPISSHDRSEGGAPRGAQRPRVIRAPQRSGCRIAFDSQRPAALPEFPRTGARGGKAPLPGRGAFALTSPPLVVPPVAARTSRVQEARSALLAAPGEPARDAVEGGRNATTTARNAGCPFERPPAR